MRFIWIFVLGLGLCVGVGFAAIQYILHDLPKLDSIEDYKPPLASRVLDAQGNLVAEFYVEKRTLVSIEQLPEHVKNAFLAAEDADFYNHQGIDYLGIVRAVLNEIKYKLIGGQRLGGSTITQQTAKTMLLSRQRTYTRKLKEFILAKRIEDALTKKEILNLYLNQIYFGNGAYGIEEAARTYYGVGAKELTLGQAAALAAVPKSPNRINPQRDPVRVKARRDYVLEQMAVHGFASEQAVKAARSESVQAKVSGQPYLNRAPHYAEEIRRILIAQFGEDTVYHGGLTIYTPINMRLQLAARAALREGLRRLDKRQGYRGPVLRFSGEPLQKLRKALSEKRKSLFAKRDAATIWNLSALTEQQFQVDFAQAVELARAENLAVGEIVGGLVKNVSNATKAATIDLGTQDANLNFAKMAWARPFNPESRTPAPKLPGDVLKAGDIVMVRIDQITPRLEVSLEQIPQVEGAIAAIEPFSHRVLAMVGGYDFFSSSFNRATQAKRQPGSSFKPLIYATAIEKEAVTPATLITDAPKVYFDANTDNQWKPQNSTRKFLGDITVRSCLIRSVNTCSITLIEKVGIDAVRDLAARAGEVTERTPLPRDLTLALGSGEVIPLLHFNAYTLFPNGGRYAPPVMIEKVVSKEGTTLFEAKLENTEVIRPEAAYVMTNMMRGLMHGQGRTVTGLTDPLAGKTGTTNQFRSAWFIGFSQDLVAGVYVGFDNNTPLGPDEFGVKAAMPAWGLFMKEALKVIPAREFTQPEGVAWRLIDPKTGLLAQSSATYEPGAASPADADESEAAPAAPTPGRAVMEVFIKGTEPTKTSGESGPPPLELFDVGGVSP